MEERSESFEGGAPRSRRLVTGALPFQSSGRTTLASDFSAEVGEFLPGGCGALGPRVQHDAGVPTNASILNITILILAMSDNSSPRRAAPTALRERCVQAPRFGQVWGHAFNMPKGAKDCRPPHHDVVQAGRSLLAVRLRPLLARGFAPGHQDSDWFGAMRS